MKQLRTWKDIMGQSTQPLLNHLAELCGYERSKRCVNEALSELGATNDAKGLEPQRYEELLDILSEQPKPIGLAARIYRADWKLGLVEVGRR